MKARAPTRQPLLWAGLAFVAGILAPDLPSPGWWLVIAGLMLLAAAGCRFWPPVADPPQEDEPNGSGQINIPAAVVCRSWLGWGLAVAGLAALGAWCTQAVNRQSASPPDLSPFTNGKPLEITGRVVRDGLMRGRPGFQRQSVDVETEQVKQGGASYRLTAGIRFSLNPRVKRDEEHEEETGNEAAPRVTDPDRPDPGVSETPSTEPFTYGQRVRLKGRLRELHDFKTPGVPSIREPLLQQGIAASGSGPIDAAKVMPGVSGSRWERWRCAARRNVLRRIERIWPGEQAPLFNAILIGEQRLVDNEVKLRWQRTGLYHLLIVSGMKIGILAFAVIGLLRWLKVQEWLATAAALLACTGYAFLADMATPVLRALLMLAIYLIMRLLHRGQVLLNALGAAALILLAVDTAELQKAAFQLSFLSMLAIGALALPVLERTSGEWKRVFRKLWDTAGDCTLPPRYVQLRLDLRLLADRLVAVLPTGRQPARRVLGASFCGAGKLLLLIYDSVIFSYILQLAMTVPMANHFSRASVTGVAANAISVPLTGFLIPASAVALVLSYIWGPLAYIPAGLARFCLAGIAWSAAVCDRLPLADVRVPAPESSKVLVVLATAVLASLLIRRRAWVAAGGVAVLTIATVWLVVARESPRFVPAHLEVTAIDVGQAESTLIVTPEGRTVLIDAGGSLGPFGSDFDIGERVVAPYLWSRRIRRLDAVVVTHAHSDHIGGMPAVISAFQPRELWLSLNPENAELDRVKQAMRSAGGKIIERWAGDEFDFGGAHFRVIAPPRGWPLFKKELNDDSLVLHVSYGGTSALLTADAQKKEERIIAAQQPQADLLKVGHNGSLTSTSPRLLAAVRPHYAVVFAGEGNSYKNPRDEVLQRLAQAGVNLCRTDRNGATTFLLDGKKVEVQPYLGKCE